MTDTLRGLSYMHELGSGPIVHGDIKLVSTKYYPILGLQYAVTTIQSNILVTANETAMICDFGRSRQPPDQPSELTNSSPFAGTVRYMSPELLVSNVVRPTPAADMWAYGCVALEVGTILLTKHKTLNGSFGWWQILCRVPPYHEIDSEFEVAELIKRGHPPSDRPRGARASLVNDTLWGALSLCWQGQDWRPTSRAFLEQLMDMLQNGQVPTSPVLLDFFPSIDSGPVARWPEKLTDLRDLLEGKDHLASSIRSNVWTWVILSYTIVLLAD
jgi:serine/threonine protein kinase